MSESFDGIDYGNQPVSEQPTSLSDRKEQLEDKVNRVIEKQSDVNSGISLDKPTSSAASPVEPTPDVQKSAYVQNNPYCGSLPTAESAGSVSLYQARTAPPKKKMSTGSKMYLIIIVGVTVIFILGFAFECARSYSSYGIFGGDEGIFGNGFDKFLDSDYDFGFSFGDFDDSDEDTSSDSDDGIDFIGNDTDKDPSELLEPPDKNTVVNKASANITAVNQPSDIDSQSYTARSAYKKVENSVVNVVVFKDKIGSEEEAYGTGSGIIISEDGYIVTNSHVINDSNDYAVEIITTQGTSYAAAIVGYDSRTDLAVLKIKGSGLEAAEFVNSDQVEVGQDAIAVGSPGGVAYSNSLTRGCVSAINRTVSTNKLVNYIQTDAAINPGNSGGPLLNSAGQVMGITTIKIAASDYEGMGFAIPSNIVIDIANDLIGQGYVSGRVRIGIVGTETTVDILGGKPAGITINEFAQDSPFKETDAKAGDIITAINGNDITDFPELYYELSNYSPGDEVSVTLYRGATSTVKSKSFDVKITLIADNGETQNK